MKVSPHLVPVLLLVVAGFLGGPQPAAGQPATITIKLKAFDTNEPTRPLRLRDEALVYARDRQTGKAFPLEVRPVKKPEKDDGLYEVQISKGWLVEQLEIGVVDREVFNPVIVTKIVSSAEMTIYPGASKSTDPFSFEAYTAQMSAYRALLAQLLEDVDQKEQDRRRAILVREFKTQLQNMSDVDARLTDAEPEQKATARELATEVLKLYRLPYAEEPILSCYFPCAPWCSGPPWDGASAMIMVRVPEDAKVFFGTHPTVSTGTVRYFATPALTPGKDFSYKLRAEMIRGDKTEVEIVHVPVRASHL